MSELKDIKTDAVIQKLNDDIFIALFKKGAYEFLEKISSNYSAESESVLSEACDKKMLALVKKEVHKDNARKNLRRAAKIAAAVIIFLVVCSVTILSVEAFRVPVFNLFIRSDENSTHISVGDAPTSLLSFNEPSYLPSGYELEKTEDFGGMDTLIYINDQGNTIIITRYSTGSNFSIDTENAEVGNLDINQYEGLYSIKDGTVLLTFRTAEYAYLITAPIDLSEAVKIAESIN